MRLTGFAAAGAVVLLAAACGGGSDDGAGSGEVPDTLTVWRMGDASEDQNAFMDDVTQQYQELYPDTDVEIQWIPWGEFSQRFQTAMVSGGPDVVEIGNDQVATWADAGALYDVADLAQEWEHRDDLLDAAYANGTFDQAQYSVPWYSGVRALWYNTDQLEEIGHEPPETWDELIEVAEALEEEYGIPGMAAPTDFVNGIGSFVWAAGGEFAVEEGGEWEGRLDTPETAEGLEFYASLISDGHSPSACVGIDEVECGHADFANREVGMFIDGPWAEDQIAEINDEHSEHWATAPIPGVDGMAPAFGGGSDLAVWGTSEHPEAAFDYITTLNSKENAIPYNEIASMFPTFEDVLASDTFQEDPVQAGAATQATGDLRLFPDTPNWGHVQWELATVQNAVERLAEGEDPDDVLPELDEELTEALNRPTDE
ncbi:extracellular solute-binding protein [Nocardiopsis kunsanensis]|uniref:Sugar ABC transporter substrate-binding protein n=1 Tax=Nocardiopsis kunsanensis TaxID=141693 RepID=A0A918X5T4_9ACTN|nr:extracellular solute-binding protein [Nocardiopsis kunsanensis]GHD14386.1 sugar ABC transporter substrate-binding protein [Nocardiopsis kunsanensis]